MKDMYECTDVSPYAEKNGFEVGAVYEGGHPREWRRKNVFA